MEGYVGKSVSEPMLDYGRPAEVYDLPNGQRAFQWEMQSSGVMPVNSYGSANVYGSGGWATATTTQTNYVPYSQSCRYTLIGERDGNDWIIVSFRKPTLGCE